MGNGSQVATGHTRLIVSVVGILSGGSLCLGTWLIFKGYQTGELLIATGGQGVAGLLGFLGGKAMMQQQPDITVSGTPPKLEVTQPQPAEKTP